MATEKSMTVKILRETHKVSDEVKDNLKQINKDKKNILEALKEGEQTIAQLSKATGMDRAKTLYITMSLAKFGFVATGKVDDMDEYFTYKLKTK